MRGKKLGQILGAMAASLVALACASPVPAVVDGVEAPCNDRRYDAIGLFLTTYDTTVCGGGVSGSCTLIAPNMVLLARHSLNIAWNVAPTYPDVNPRHRVRFRRATNGQSVNYYFYNGTTCHGIYQEILVDHFIDAGVPGLDMVFGVLEHPVQGIAPIPVELLATPATGDQIIIAGWGYAGECSGQGDHWTLHTATGVLPDQGSFPSQRFNFSPCTFGTVPCSSCPSGGPWVHANQHDSGGPVLIERMCNSNGNTVAQLRLVGVMVTDEAALRPLAWNSALGLPQMVQNVSCAPCLSDFNKDGVVNINDMFDFLHAFFAGLCTANVSGHAPTTVSDIFMFISRFMQGC